MHYVKIRHNLSWLSQHEIEAFIEMEQKGRKRIIGCVYKQRNMKINDLMNIYARTLRAFSRYDKFVNIMLAFNVDHLNCSRCTTTCELSGSMTCNFF